MSTPEQLIEDQIKEAMKKAKADTQEFRDRYLVPAQDELTMVLKAHLYLESLIDELISETLVKSKWAEDLTFSNKVSLLECLGFNNEILGILRRLNGIRNRFAHKLDYSVTIEEANELVKGLNVAKALTARDTVLASMYYLIGYLNAQITLERLVPVGAIFERMVEKYKQDQLFLALPDFRQYQQTVHRILIAS